MDPPGLEPGASALQGQRSPNWATGPYNDSVDDLVFDCNKSTYISNSIYNV